MASAQTLSTLRSDLEKARNNMDLINGDIKKLTGRDPTELKNIKRQHSDKDASNMDLKSRLGSAYIEPPELDDVTIEKQTEPFSDELKSQVTIRNERPRFAFGNVLGDSEKARGRRMFGLLQGTLNAAKKDSESKKQLDQEKKRREIDERLEKQQKVEKEHLRKEREELFKNRRERQIELSTLEAKVRVTEEFERWKRDMLSIRDYIRTTCSPTIYYKPRVHNAVSKTRLQDTQDALAAALRDREEILQLQLDDSDRIREKRMENLRSGRTLGAKDHTDAHSDNEDELPSVAVKRSRRHMSPDEDFEDDNDLNDDLSDRRRVHLA